jgi:hypothetical protein
VRKAIFRSAKAKRFHNSKDRRIDIIRDANALIGLNFPNYIDCKNGRSE